MPADGASATCLARYRERRDWDAAFEVIVRSGWPLELEALLSAALDELLDAARLVTLEHWCDFAVDAQLTAPLFSVARAEVMLRRGCHIEAIAHADSAAREESSLAYRAIAIAGRAAHLASREEEALEFYRRAKSAAATGDERRDALWGELACLIDLEDPRSEAALARLSEGASLGQPREFVRSAVYRLYLQMRFGSLDLEQADVAYRLLSAVSDPLVESSFLSGYAGSLALVARYHEAQSVSAELERLVRRYRLHFALPYALCVSATASAGLREWTDAERRAREALALAHESGDRHVEHVSNSLLLRILAQQGRVGSALDLQSVEPRGGQSRHLARKSCVPVRLFWPVRAAQLKRLASWMRSEARPTRLRPLCFLQLLRRSVRSGSAQRT